MSINKDKKVKKSKIKKKIYKLKALKYLMDKSKPIISFYYEKKRKKKNKKKL